MAETPPTRPTSLGIYDKPKGKNITSVEIIALALSLVWMLGAVVFFLTMGSANAVEAGNLGGLRFLVTMLAIFMPVAMIWVAATAARSSRVMREESQRLQAAIDAIRQSYVSQAQAGRQSAPDVSTVARKLDQIAEAQRKTETTLANLSAGREREAIAARKALPAPSEKTDAGETDEQVALPLGTPSEDMAPPLERADFIRAVNFPETAEDKAGFDALRRALADRHAKQLIQAAQDILTLLSQDGIYMDDLNPDMARPEVWRKFASGERGRSVAALGGVRDRSSLALTAGRMRQDPIFRDVAHHFLRRFDQTFAEFADGATDSEISALSDTRTARAFMLLGRVAGTFD